eukprot:g14847.t1
MEPMPPANGTPCSGVSPSTASVTVPSSAPDLGSTWVPRTKQLSLTGGTKTSSVTGGGGCGGGGSGRKPSGGGAPPGSSHKKKLKKQESPSSGTSCRRLTNGRRQNFPPVPSAADCLWTSNAVQFEEARAKEDPHNTPAPAPPSPLLAAAATSGAPSPVGPAATSTVMAAGGAGASATQLKPLRMWEWSKEECATVARDAIGSGGADAGKLSLLVGAAGAVLFSDSDGDDEDEGQKEGAGSDGEEEELAEEQGQEHEGEGDGMEDSTATSTSNRKRCKGKGASASSDSDGVNGAGGAGRRVRARLRHSRKATGETVEPPFAESHFTAVTVRPVDTGLEGERDNGETSSSRTGRRRAARGGEQHGQGREPGRSRNDGAAPPHPGPDNVVPSASEPPVAVTEEAIVVEDEMKARELSAKLNRNSPRRVSVSKSVSSQVVQQARSDQAPRGPSQPALLLRPIRAFQLRRGAAHLPRNATATATAPATATEA